MLSLFSVHTFPFSELFIFNPSYLFVLHIFVYGSFPFVLHFFRYFFPCFSVHLLFPALDYFSVQVL
jgi:hypothetical protein